MRRIFTLLLLALATSALFASAALAQMTPPPAAAGPAKELLNTWNRMGRDIVDVAEAMPAEKYNFKPTPEVRSFAEQLLHVAGSNYLYVDAAKGQKTGPEDLSPAKYATKADIVKVLRESVEAGAAVIGQATDAQMTEPVKSPFGNAMISRYGFWSAQIRHGAEHYGQMVVYLRLNGIVPPATARAQARQAPPPTKK